MLDYLEIEKSLKEREKHCLNTKNEIQLQFRISIENPPYSTIQSTLLFLIGFMIVVCLFTFHFVVLRLLQKLRYKSMNFEQSSYVYF